MRPEAALDAEARRIANKQLLLAVAGLEAAGESDGDRRIHTARRHVKKVRALIRLVEPRLESGAGQTQRRLRTASRMLAAIADGEALITTLGALSRRYPGAIPDATEAELCRALQARRLAGRRISDFKRTLRKVAAELARERARAGTWQIDERGVGAVAPGLRRSVRRGRRAMRRALAHPTTRRYSVWRRRVKSLWFQLRLIEGYTGGQLLGEQRQLERLDGVLGEARNCALLCDALVGGALGSRQDAARCLRVIRRYRTDLRLEAIAVAPLVHGIAPREFVARVREAWQTDRIDAPPTAVTRWPRVA
jgi:hypothetical protein